MLVGSGSAGLGVENPKEKQVVCKMLFPFFNAKQQRNKEDVMDSPSLIFLCCSAALR